MFSLNSTRCVAVSLLAMLALVACNRDPNVAKRRYLNSGNKYFDRGKFKEASIMYRNALQKDLRYGPAHYKLGLTDIKLGQFAPAVQEFRRAIDLLPPDQPDHWDSVVKLCDIYLAAAPDKQSLEETDGYIKQLLKRDTNSFDGHRLAGDLNFARAAAAMKTGQKVPARAFVEQAVAEYRKADSIKPEQIGINMQLARSLAALGDNNGAQQIYRTLIARNKTLVYAYTELYRQLMLSGQRDQAEQVLKLGFQNNPKQYGFLTMLAAHYYNLQRRDDMLQVLEQIKSHAKDFPAAYLTAGDFYLRLGNYDAALKEFRDGIAMDAKQKVTYQKRIVDVLLRQQKREEASQVNAEILKADPNDPGARTVAATLLLDKGDAAHAITELQAVISRSPNNPVAHLNLGRAHEARNELAQAREEFQKALDIQPDYLLARRAMAELELRQREWENAIQDAEQILAVNKSDVPARLIVSAALLGQRRFDESRPLLNQLLKEVPASPDVQYQLGLLNLAERRYPEAEGAFRRSYELNPATLRGLIGEVETYREQNKSEQGLALLQAEAAKSPNRVDFRMAIAATAVLMKKFDLAASEYQSVLDMPAQTPAGRADVYTRLGEVYRRKGDLTNAIASLQQARALLPGNPVILHTLALSLDGAGRRTEAAKAYEAALKADPNNAVSLNNLAFLMADTGGDLDQALTLAQRAKQLLPNTAEVSDTLGLIYLHKNLNDNAIDIFKQLVAKQPNMPTFRYHLAMALSQKGDKPHALQELQQALKDNPSKDEKQKIQQLLSHLG
jgi:tetratricopeptide (TPR) repeat protein